MSPLTKSEMGRGIARGLFLRPACHACPYTSTDRPGDLTLGVLKSESLSQEERRLGVSLLLINTVKGAQVFDTLPLQRKRCDLNEAVAADGALRTPTAMSPDRARFFEALEHEPFRHVCGRFLSMLQPREKPAARPLKELLHLPWSKKEKK